MRSSQASVAYRTHHSDGAEGLPAKRVGQSPEQGAGGPLPFAHHRPVFTHGWWVTAPRLTRSQAKQFTSHTMHSLHARLDSFKRKARRRNPSDT